MRPLQLALISEHASPLAELGTADAGGQNVHVAQLAGALAKRGHQVRVYTRRDDPALPGEVMTSEGYIVEHVPAGPPTFLAKDELLPYMAEFGEWLAARWAVTGPPDLVHAHFWMSGVAALSARLTQWFPLVVTYHALGSVKKRMQGALDTSPPGRIEFEKQIGQAATKVIAQCTDEIFELSHYGIGEERICLASSGVDTDRFAADVARLRTRQPGEPPRILSVGRLVPRKGFDHLIRILPGLPTAELYIAGGPPKEELGSDPVARELTALADDLGVRSRLHLLGAVAQADMPQLYRSMDVTVCVPAYEPFGITPLEAMASGTPVVAYAVGGLRDSIIHGRTGMLVPSGNLRRLAACLRTLFADEALRIRCARAAVIRAKALYSWARIAEQIEYAYEEAIIGPLTPVSAASREPSASWLTVG